MDCRGGDIYYLAPQANYWGGTTSILKDIALWQQFLNSSGVNLNIGE